MKKLTAEQLSDNYEKFINIIKTEISGERSDVLISFYESISERLVTAPASGNINHHNCFAGGYVDHVLNVVEAALKLFEVWKSSGATIDYTREELVFAAINHDLGKVGDLDNDYYIPNPSEWHRKNQGKIYEHNKDLTYMRVADRSLFLLQQAGVGISKNEFLAIKLHDGLYVDDNKAYFFAGYSSGGLDNHLPVLLHHADHMASIIEKEKQDAAEAPISATKQVATNANSNKNRMKSFQKIAESNTATQKHSDLFNELFKDV